MLKRAFLVAVMALCVASVAAADCSTLTTWTESLPDFFIGVPANFQIDAVGGTSPYTFTLVGGSMPPGLTLSSSGLISGTPTSTVDTTIFVKITDANGCHLTIAYAIRSY